GLGFLNSGPLAEALIYTRDGIAGTWAPGNAAGALNTETAANMQRWEPWVRASVIDFELVSRLRFLVSTVTSEEMVLEHVDTSANPIPTYPLMRIRRPTIADFMEQLDFLDRYADLRGDRATEIMTQMGGGIAFLGSIAYLSPSRTPYTLELLAAAIRLANYT